MGIVHNLGLIAFRNFTRLMNHVHIMELPLIYTHLYPRPLTSIVAAKRWKRIWTRVIVEQVGAIPLHRGTADVAALKGGIAALNEGKILLMSPEGTRSGDGRLQQGKPGVALLAIHSKAPIVPMVHFGSENYLKNIPRVARSEFLIVVGKPFRVVTHGEMVNRQVRQDITREIMYQMAALLPSRYRGVYSDLDKATNRFIEPA
jgi:1-acyl-sn-glycerol-3-phosphate acyltransferase